MLLKTIHVTCAYATGLSFLLRGVLSLSQHPLLQHRLVRKLPHLVDTVLLASAIGLFYSWNVTLGSQPWLIVKIGALLVYIAFGFAMLRWGSTPLRRWVGFVGGLATYAYIVGVAHSKSALSWIALGS